MMEHNADDADRSDRDRSRPSSRRGFLAASGTLAAGALAGCTDMLPGGSDGTSASELSLGDFRGSGPLVEQRSAPEGTSIDDLPDLSGELTMYLGGGESGLYLDLVDLLEQIYPDFSVSAQQESASNLANRIAEENRAGSTPADVFMAVDAGSLGSVAEDGAAVSMSAEVTDPVRDAFKDSEDRWVGFAGRARAIPYNTNELSASDVPSTVAAFPETSAFGDSFGWAPSYSAFQSFVTAMRVIEDDETTRQWLQSMQDLGVTTYDNEFAVSNRVADGEISAGFANHYYSLRVQSDRSSAPIDLAFTEGDAGALVNVSGAQILDGTENKALAENFLRHVLSAEAQEFFATRTYAYPMISGVEPVGDLPTIDELNPPDIDLGELSDLGGTVDMLREVGVL
ncbi:MULTISPECIES: extracellular solute-binding protein [Halomicrobium]|uniref:Extracellular solute-binding protein family 1 n=2 Tax=Halomicrobium mukohataei TaxID=57705 RepID=C7NXF5_HALMD|nr:extracellular solute-binding protein family 1 [Halomicrobium mukohataei DSM 12286]QCD66800.1 extracellular solute-binding protein [Halomicrobium mukohataei]QFR21609.1 extracellular solute-binding protein [Halomicrobium sp. ZPS1]